MTDLPLDNVIWHALTGAQAQCAVGSGGARRYAPGYSAIAGFADPARPDLTALAAHCAPDEPLYCLGWSGAPDAGWRIDAQATVLRMVWDGGIPRGSDDAGARALAADDADAALGLAALTRPGPFGRRTIELGDYLGVFDGSRLVAMAGERLHAGRWREISGVCTHPERQGRGHARRLMEMLIRRQMQRGETPFLHVMQDNAGAVRLYERMGFRLHQALVVRIIART